MKRFLAPTIALILGIVAATAVHSSMESTASQEQLNETTLQNIDVPASSPNMTMMEGYDRYLSEPGLTLMPTQNA